MVLVVAGGLSVDAEERADVRRSCFEGRLAGRADPVDRFERSESRAIVAVFALVADGTVPRVVRLMLLPVSVFFLILAPVTASFLILFVTTAFFFSCLLPTLFFGRFVAASAVPIVAMTRAMIEIRRAARGDASEGLSCVSLSNRGGQAAQAIRSRRQRGSGSDRGPRITRRTLTGVPCRGTRVMPHITTGSGSSRVDLQIDPTTTPRMTSAISACARRADAAPDPAAERDPGVGLGPLREALRPKAPACG